MVLEDSASSDRLVSQRLHEGWRLVQRAGFKSDGLAIEGLDSRVVVWLVKKGEASLEMVSFGLK